MTIRIIATYLTLITTLAAIGQVDSTSSKIDSSAAAFEYKYIDDLKRLNIIIDNFKQLQENCVKIQLDTVINFQYTLHEPSSNFEFFFSKSFTENSFFQLHLKNLLVGKDQKNTWAGYANIYNEYIHSDSIEGKEVIPTQPPYLLISNKNISIYLLDYRYLLIFDSLNNYIGGFDAFGHDGNSHGATNITTNIYPDLKFEIIIDDWNESTNRKGTQITNIYKITKDNKLIRTFYTSKKREPDR